MARLWIDPALAEEAVFLRARQLESAGDVRVRAWHGEREALYAEPDPALRQHAFAELGLQWFERLGLDRPLHEALRITPRLPRVLAEIRVRRALGARQEGSDVFGAGVKARFELALAPARLLDPSAARGFLLRECLRADDMLDPAFGYRVDLGPGLAAARAELVRDRLAVLWEARVLGRVALQLGAELPPKPPPAFARAFREADPRRVLALYERASLGRLATFDQLLAAARGELEVRSEVGSASSGESAAARGARSTVGSPP